MKRLFLLLVALSLFVSSMEQPPRLAKKRVAQAESEFVQTARSIYSRNFIKMLDKGSVVTFGDLDILADVTSDPATTATNIFFWERNGIGFLIKANLAPIEPATLKNLTAMQVGKNIAASKEDYLQAIQKLPVDLRTIVTSRNPKLIAVQLKNLLRVFDKQNAKRDQQIDELINERALALWDAVLAHETIPFAISIISDLRRSFKAAGKEESTVFNSMIDALVNKICKNILLITARLNQNNLLNPLIREMRAHFDKNIRENRGLGDLSYLREDKKVLLGLLSATPESCPALVRQQLLEITR